MIKNFAEFISESNSEESLLEYSSYRISNWEELVAGLQEIGAPISISKTDKSITVDGKNLRFPKDSGNTMKSIRYDDEVNAALRNNDALNKMWKEVNHQYSSILNNLRQLTSVTKKISDPHYINWGNTGPAEINRFYAALRDQYEFATDLLANQKTQEILRKYEVLRHLYDRGYISIASK